MRRDLILNLQREKDKALKKANEASGEEKRRYHLGRASGIKTALLLIGKATDSDIAFALARAGGNDVTYTAELLERVEKRLCDALEFFSEREPLYSTAQEAKLDIADAIALLKGDGYSEET